MSPFDEFKPTVQMFDNGGTTVHPVSAVNIKQPAHFLDGGTMDVATHHTIQAAFAHCMDDGILEIVDKTDRRFNLALGIARQRPVSANMQGASHPRQPGIGPDQQIVGDIAEYGDPAMMARNLIELVPVYQ